MSALTESPTEPDLDAIGAPHIWRRYRGRIFIGYRRDGSDILFARDVRYELERIYGRRSVFFDDENLEGGEAWRAVIDRELGRRTKPWVVYCVGSSWSASPGVRFEIEQIKAKGLASTLVLDSEASFKTALKRAAAHEDGKETAAWLDSRVRNCVGISELGRELRRCVVGGNLKRVWPRRRRLLANAVLGVLASSAVGAAIWFGASAFLPPPPECELAAACELGARLGEPWQIVDELADPVPPLDDVCEGYSVAGISRSVDFLSNETEGAIAIQSVDVGSSANVQARWAELQTRVRECSGEVEMNGSVLRLTVVQQLLPYQRSFWIDGTSLIGTAYRSYNDRPSEFVTGRIDAVAGGAL